MVQKFLPFDEAREYVRTLGLKKTSEWKAYCRSGKRPDTIPSDPHRVYKDQFQNIGDWLGTGNAKFKRDEFLSFKEARAFVWTLGLKSQKEWSNYCRSGRLPVNIPVAAHTVYKQEFQGYGDWLGTRNIANRYRVYLPFAEARAFVHTLGLKNQKEWYDYCRSGKKPDNIPRRVERTYKQDWQGLGDWLGTDTIATRYFWMRSGIADRKVFRRISRRAGEHARRAHKKAVLGTYTPVQIQEQLKRQKHRCYYAACGFAKFEKRNGKYIYVVEHTFPLSRVAGTDIPANDISYLVLACPSCNRHKNDKFPWEWPEGGRLL